jgi:protein-disulfide isomerase
MTSKQPKAARQANAQRAAERAAAIRKEQEAKERRRRTLTVTAVVVVVLVAILGIGYAVQSSRDTTGHVGSRPTGVVGKYTIPYGKASAPVKLTVYEDFMCPFCGQFEAASRSMVQQYVGQGDVQVQYRVIAFLDDSSAGTKYSTRAMNAFGVVFDKAGPQVAKRFHDLLFENQPAEGSTGLSDQQLVDLAVKAGANKDEVSGPIKSVAFQQWVKNATDAASKKGVNSTPTVLLDGKELHPQSIQGLVAELKQKIDAKLKK